MGLGLHGGKSKQMPPESIVSQMCPDILFFDNKNPLYNINF